MLKWPNLLLYQATQGGDKPHPVTHDQIRSLGRPNYTDLGAFEEAFGIAPRPFDIGYLAH